MDAAYFKVFQNSLEDVGRYGLLRESNLEYFPVAGADPYFSVHKWCRKQAVDKVVVRLFYTAARGGDDPI